MQVNFSTPITPETLPKIFEVIGASNVTEEERTRWINLVEKGTEEADERAALSGARPWLDVQLSAAATALDAHRATRREKLFAFARSRDRRGLTAFRSHEQTLENLIRDISDAIKEIRETFKYEAAHVIKMRNVEPQIRARLNAALSAMGAPESSESEYVDGGE